MNMALCSWLSILCCVSSCCSTCSPWRRCEPLRLSTVGLGSPSSVFRLEAELLLFALPGSFLRLLLFFLVFFWCKIQWSIRVILRSASGQTEGLSSSSLHSCLLQSPSRLPHWVVRLALWARAPRREMRRAKLRAFGVQNLKLELFGGRHIGPQLPLTRHVSLRDAGAAWWLTSLPLPEGPSVGGH